MNLPEDLKEDVEKSVTETKIFNIKVGVPTPKYKKKYETEYCLYKNTNISAVLSHYPDFGLVSVLNFTSAKHTGWLATWKSGTGRISSKDNDIVLIIVTRG